VLKSGSSFKSALAIEYRAIEKAGNFAGSGSARFSSFIRAAYGTGGLEKIAETRRRHGEFAAPRVRLDHYLGDRRPRFAILISARLDRPNSAAFDLVLLTPYLAVFLRMRPAQLAGSDGWRTAGRAIRTLCQGVAFRDR
jgi:hypothetical protein